MSKLREILTKAENIFIRFGFKSVTMDYVAGDMGISKKTLYRFVENKQDLILKVVRHHIEQEKELVENILASDYDALRQLLAITKHVNESLQKVNPSLIYDLQKYYSAAWDIVQDYRVEFVYDTIVKNLKQGMEEGVYRDEIDAEILARIYTGTMEMILDNKLFPYPKFKQFVVYQKFIQYHINGIASPKGLELLTEYLNEQKGEKSHE